MNKNVVLDMIPKKIITKTIGFLVKTKFSKVLIKPYIKIYQINETEIEKKVKEYKTLNEFFTRKLKEGERKIEEEAVVSPVDGYIKEIGKINNGEMLQIKGVNYKIEKLLKKENAWKEYENGTYVNIYLSPTDYHRIHSPIKGSIKKIEHIEGKLYPVNNMGVKGIDGLYTKNERVNVYIENEEYEIVLSNVGTLIVGSVVVKGEKIEKNQMKTYENKEVKKGEEIGHFEFGSTVLMMIKKKNGDLDIAIEKNEKIKMGKKVIKK